MDVAAVVISIVALVVSIGAAVLTAFGVYYQRRTHRDTTRRAKETTVAVYYTLEQIMRRVSETPILAYDEGMAACKALVLPHPFLAPGRSIEVRLEWRFDEEQWETEVNCEVVSPSGSASRATLSNAETITVRYPEDFPSGSTAEPGRYEVRWQGRESGKRGTYLGVTSFLVGPF
jgi:hypothetical protein